MANIPGTNGPDVLTGTSSADTITGLAGNDRLFGLGGNDFLNGGPGSDVMIGGTGHDIYIVNSPFDVVIEGVSQGIDQIRSVVSVDLNSGGMRNAEYLTLLGSASLNGYGNALHNLITGNSAANTLRGEAGNDALYGEGGNDRLEAGAGNDFLFGGAGGDVLDGGAGADTMRGEAGSDIYHVDSTADVVTEAAAAGSDSIYSYVTLSLSVAGRFEVENLRLFGASAINGNGNAKHNLMTGNTANNVMGGFAGNDQLFGIAGNDHLDGGLGADKMAGGSGDDGYMVDNAGDIATEFANSGLDTVYTTISLNLSTAAWANIERLTMLGTNPLHATGNALGNLMTGNGANNLLNGLGGIDYLYGQGGNDILQGGAGNDFLNGGAGIDTMQGGAGDDTFVVDNAGDFVIEAAGGGTADRIQSYITTTLSANGRFAVENLELYLGAAINGTGNSLNNGIAGNNSANSLSGLAGHDTLHGQGGNDILNGGTGNDTLRGGLGADIITGGVGSDAFYFDTSLRGGVDTIVDFVPLSDTIYLDNAIFAVLSATGPLAAAAFHIGAAAADASGRIIYNPAGGALYYDADGTGVLAQVQFADLASGLGVTAADFYVF
jgi:Ca2+-binding RTX toxin-like protein